MLGEMLTHARQMFSRAFQQNNGGDERRAQALAAVILAGIDGLALQQLAQPDADLLGAYELLLALILAESTRRHLSFLPRFGCTSI